MGCDVLSFCPDVRAAGAYFVTKRPCSHCVCLAVTVCFRKWMGNFGVFTSLSTWVTYVVQRAYGFGRVKRCSYVCVLSVFE